MKPSFFILGICTIFLFLTSCNSVKRVLNDPIKFEKVAKEVVKRGYCINDTVTITKDSIEYKTKDSIIKDTVDTPCPDFTAKTKNGATVISKNGVMTVTFPIKTKEIHTTRIITNNIRDKKLESILTTERDSLQILYTKSEKDLKEINKELSAEKRKNTFTWIGIGLIILAFIGVKTGLFKKIIPFM